MTSETRVDPQYLSALPYYARHGQDRYLDEAVYCGKRNGVFVDIGAYDGVESSNTLFFEEHRAWTGVCVEPLPGPFSRLLRNRACVCINACASDAYRTASFTRVVPDVPSRAPTSGRVPNYEKLSGLTAFYNAPHQEVIAGVLKRVGGHTEVFDVQCMPVDDILARARSRRIDCLSLDTEGSEFTILQAIDYQRFDIDVIVVEVLYPTDAFCAFMERVGYRRLAIVGYDWIYRRTVHEPASS